MIENKPKNKGESSEMDNEESYIFSLRPSKENNRSEYQLKDLMDDNCVDIRRSCSNISIRCPSFYYFHKELQQKPIKIYDDNDSFISDTKIKNILDNMAGNRDSMLFHSLTTSSRSVTENDIKTKCKKSKMQTSHPFHGLGGLSFHENMFFQKWNALKSSIKLKNFKKKEKKDIHKPVKLLSQLEVGVPTVLMFASVFQRDDNGRRRVPILLDQLKIDVLESKNTKSRSHALFQIKLKYGDGENAVEWSVYKEWRDFLNLHARYRVSETMNSQFKKAQGLPAFPKSSAPYLRSIRGFTSDDSDTCSKKSIKSSKQDKFTETNCEISGVNKKANFAKNHSFSGMQRRKLEEYLRKMAHLFIFRLEGIRLCSFLELSALGIKLGKYEKYHGKEGLLAVVNSKGSTRKMTCNPIEVRDRSLPKWYLVRESYIVCVNDISSTKIYDVFLMDDGFEIARKHFSKEISSYSSKVKRDNLNKYQPKRHTFKIKNCERQVKLLAKNEITVQQFMENIKDMSKATIWTTFKRFNSFSPVRTNVAAQWIIDARDYFWNVSRAILNAKETIYIHDWWLSPELYLRRPACVSEDWRLDRLLKKKADEGVQIYIIIYRNVGTTVPIDSAYTKYSLLSLSPNIYVQRSPSHLRQSIFFWAHHEKIICIDEKISFIGGIDLCFGRWDSYEHVLYDDKPSGWDEKHNPIPQIPEEPLIWPGKDYSNPRIHDFFTLDKPYEDMYNRTLVPRMAWHDISMQIVGQPSRDIARHFVQRWNYHLRNKSPRKSIPFLVPPPDFTQEQLEKNGFLGTNELQVLRSAGPWSIGTPMKIEHSILNAYVKCIETSEHFIYIENQFFITSSECEGAIIENSIGDALVKRIIKAYKNNEKWRAIIILPLLPGFQNDVDSQEGTSLRLIMHCQYRSICRCKYSIFKRLEAAGIDPIKYIRIYSLRNWAKLKENGRLVSEMVYVHAKCMIVDDRICIIGSANINERSMRGNRDSEIAAIVRDTEMQLSTMAGKSYMVGRFSYTLRVRLMTEHLGINCDEMEKMDCFMDGLSKDCKWKDIKTWDCDSLPTQENLNDEEKLIKDDFSRENRQLNELYNKYMFSFQEKDYQYALNEKKEILYQINSNIPRYKEFKNVPEFSEISFGRRKVTTTTTHLIFGLDVRKILSGSNCFNTNPLNQDSIKLEIYEESDIEKQKISDHTENLDKSETDSDKLNKDNDLYDFEKTNDSTKKKFESKISSENWQKIKIDPLIFSDPLADSFFEDIWDKIAQRNTEIYRQVFRCMPDNKVRTWKEYYRYKRYSEKFMQRYESKKINTGSTQEISETLPPYYQEPYPSFSDTSDSIDNIKSLTMTISKSTGDLSKEINETNLVSSYPSTFSNKKPSKNSDEIFLEPQEILEEKLLKIQGHLVIWPTDWLIEEYNHGNWLSTLDHIPPIDIYT
ncbi:hypothetical protein T552_02001 [Pneumocystis carinii B80]|uniref:Phospholipase n=1 Tax=Pneumocystis carinii (strain B80) TaxID=1408658 RepID=A0A0W4ZIG4_PNEC8|nr:hypothetical protein T552_02001 [Pneumocystis carinii B80]KTW28142.1 hypothetical protein T552_02001 [Pneumocystis carinii B80]